MRGLRTFWRWILTWILGTAEDIRMAKEGPAPGPKPLKLHLVVREDIPPGLQAAQLVHAAMEFMAEYPEEAAAWRKDSNCVALLAVSDEGALESLAGRARTRALTSEFREPDLGGSLTAIAVSPSSGGRRICGGLPLAFRENRVRM